MRRLVCLGLALITCSALQLVPACSAVSVFTSRPEDPKAQDLSASEFRAHADGQGDDTASLQAAIDKVQETTGEGILFVPEGRYRITHTVYVWPGIRIIGYGRKRPVMVLPDNTPGYQTGVSDMFFYAGGRPAPGAKYHGTPSPPGPVPPTKTMPDANPGTFYSAMNNVDFEIGEGNPSAVAIRFHAAQHSYLAHIDFHIGSGLAGLHDIGNEGEDLHFFGGRYGILTRKPSPAWQFTLLDSTFEGQREAAIRENEAGLTVVHAQFKNLPTAIKIDRDYSDQLWIKDSHFEDITGPALVISNETSRMTEINGENLWCSHVPVFAELRPSGRQLRTRSDRYEVKVLSHGLLLPGEEEAGSIQTRFETAETGALPLSAENVIAALPPVSDWVNLRTLGAKGDGKTDDTQAIQKAIAGHRVVYVPMGFYIVTDTIRLRPDSVLIALHPDQTQFYLPDGTAAFRGPGAPMALLEAPEGGHTIVSGLGLSTNGNNSRAVGALWMAGRDSLMDDVRFLGGHGTAGLDGTRLNPYNNTHTGDPDSHRRWDSQYPSLWITRNGGGTFANIWTPSTFAQAGLYVSDTSTPGRVFELSSEHHVRTEIKFKNVAHWELDALQTEGESGESANAYSLDIDSSRDLTIANYHGYRVVRSYQPFPYAVRIAHSSDIRFRNFHVDNNSSIGACNERGEDCRQLVRAGKVSYADAILDQTTKGEVRDREFAWLDITGHPRREKAGKQSVVLASGASPQILASGFFNLSGGTVDAQGNLYFADPHWNRIYRLDAETRDLTIVRDNALDPVNLVSDKSGNLVVISSAGKTETAYSLKPDAPESQVTLLERQAAKPRPHAVAALPVDYWVNGDFSNTLDTKTYEYLSLDEMFRKKMSAPDPFQYVSEDGSVFIPATDVFVQGEPYFGSKWSDQLMATQLVKGEVGQTFYVTDEADQKTYRGTLQADGTLQDIKVFAQQGGESLARDKAGHVFLAAGQIYVYDSAGKVLEVIRMPQRPTQLVFGGRDRRTLFVLSHSFVYALRMRAEGL